MTRRLSHCRRARRSHRRAPQRGEVTSEEFPTHAVSPDGKHAAVVRGRFRSDVVLIKSR